MATNEKIKAIYGELKGYLDQAPVYEQSSHYLSDETLWEQYNACITELTEVSEEDYSRFLIGGSSLISLHGGKKGLPLSVYKQRLGGIIGALHSTYFSQEKPPFNWGNEGASTVVSQNQSQSQSFRVELVLEVQELVMSKMDKYDEGTKEKKFLTKVKELLSGVSTGTQLINMICKEAKSLGLTVEQIIDLFS